MASDEFAQSVLARIALLRQLYPHVDDERMRRRLEDALIPPMELDGEWRAMMEARLGDQQAQIDRLRDEIRDALNRLRPQ